MGLHGRSNDRISFRVTLIGVHLRHLRIRFSPEKAMEPPAGGGLVGVEAGAEQPVSPARLVLDPVVVARRTGLWTPPFGRQPLRALGMADAVRPAPPAEEDRRVVRNRRHG